MPVCVAQSYFYDGLESRLNSITQIILIVLYLLREINRSELIQKREIMIPLCKKEAKNIKPFLDYLSIEINPKKLVG